LEVIPSKLHQSDITCPKGERLLVLTSMIGVDINVEHFHFQVFPSMIGVDINVDVSINAKGGYCCTMLSLMSKD
jgi:hypothetical protein